MTPSVTSMNTEMKIYLQYVRIDRTCERSINAYLQGTHFNFIEITIRSNWSIKNGSRTFAPMDICPLPKTACDDICSLIHIREWTFTP